VSIVDQARAELEALGQANRAFMKRYPGDRPARQPVHTVYGGAQLYKAETTRKLGELARESLRDHAPDPAELARGVGLKLSASLAEKVYARVVQKLAREPVEDFRIDFEDGFGARSDQEEDEAAVSAAKEVARGFAAGVLPPFMGIRVKSFGEEWKLRGARTFELFFDTLLSATGGQLPANFVVTLPKITVAEQPGVLVKLFELMEHKHGLPAGTFEMEIMIEVTQALLGADGRSPLPGFLAACQGRCTGAHLGTYDFTASCNITAGYQAMDHWMCDQAKAQMMFAYAGSGVFLSDGATNVMPVGPRASVHAAWQLAARHIRHSLEGGFYQGWDLHPAQLPVRYATCYAFFLEGFDAAAERLRNFVDKAAQATLVGDVFDDAATGQGLLNYFLRALNCGAITLDDMAQTGLTQEEVALRSFAKILAARRARLSR
jgi:citrate lyase beta subunit